MTTWTETAAASGSTSEVGASGVEYVVADYVLVDYVTFNWGEVPPVSGTWT